MTIEALNSPHASTPGWLSRVFAGRSGPLAVVILVLVVIWYLGTVWLNAPILIDGYERRDVDWSFSQLVDDSMVMERPILPAPHQVVAELDKSILGRKVTSKRSLVYHAWVTLSSTLLGFVMGTVLGIVLAVGIVHVKTLDRSLLPWVIASQTIPILAIAPMIIVVLGNIGFTGLVPKALISMYLCFFPVTIGMVKGLRSPDPFHLDLMRTYSATRAQVFWKLRWPSALPFLFVSMKIGIAASLVGAIVAELPTGAVAGIGAKLLQGSYYSQSIQMWSALVVGSVLAALLVVSVGVVERIALGRMGRQS